MSIVKQEFKIDITSGFTSTDSLEYNFYYRYKKYSIEVIKDVYTEGIPHTDILTEAIKQIHINENLPILDSMFNYVRSTNRDIEFVNRQLDKTTKVIEILSIGGFNNTFYFIHELKDLDVSGIIQSLPETKSRAYATNQYYLRESIVHSSNSSLLAKKLNDLKKDCEKSKRDIERSFEANKNKIIHEFAVLNSKYKSGDIILATLYSWSEKEVFVIINPTVKIGFDEDNVKAEDIKITYNSEKVLLSGKYSAKETFYISEKNILSVIGRIEDYDTKKLSELCRQIKK
jgi:hypothetical protein